MKIITAHRNSSAICCNLDKISYVVWTKFKSESIERNRYENESITINRTLKMENHRYCFSLLSLTTFSSRINPNDDSNIPLV